MCDMTHSYVWHDSFICVTWLIHMCDMTHSYVWHDVFMCVPWLANLCAMTHWCMARLGGKIDTWCVRHDSFICVTRLVHACVMNRFFVCNESHWLSWLASFAYACTEFNRSISLTRAHPWDSHIFVAHKEASHHTYIHTKKRVMTINETWLVHMCDMTCSCMCHDSLLCVHKEAKVMTRFFHKEALWSESSQKEARKEASHDFVAHKERFLCGTQRTLSLWTLLCEAIHHTKKRVVTINEIHWFMARLCKKSTPDVWDVTRMCDMTHWCVCHDSFVCLVRGGFG